MRAKITEILTFVSLSFKCFAVGEYDNVHFRMRPPIRLRSLAISDHRPYDCRSQNRGLVQKEILSRRPIETAPRSPGIKSGGVYANQANAKAHGLLLLGILVVTGPVMDPLTERCTSLLRTTHMRDDAAT